jgi:hypothetical protein
LSLVLSSSPDVFGRTSRKPGRNPAGSVGAAIRAAREQTSFEMSGTWRNSPHALFDRADHALLAFRAAAIALWRIAASVEQGWHAPC